MKAETYTDTVMRIQSLDGEITQLSREYRELRDLTAQLDRQIMALHQAKWRLERELIKPTILPSCRRAKLIRDVADLADGQRSVAEIPIDELINSFDRMTPAQRESLRALVAQRLEDSDDVEEVENND